MKKQKLNPKDLVPGIFVLVETSNECFEIGITKTVELVPDQKELKILLLTESDFEELPPTFNPQWLPFLTVSMGDLDPNEYTLYSIDSSIVHTMFAAQKKHLEEQKIKFDVAYTHASSHYAPERSGLNERIFHEVSKETIATLASLEAFNFMYAEINKLVHTSS